jgi:hypothetical protein
MNTAWIKASYVASACYDALLAFVFLFFVSPVFSAAGVDPPNHMGYLHFPALILLVFAAMYWKIGSDPARHREFMPYGMGLKASYILVVLYHWAAGNIPWLWIPLAWIDLVFLALFFAGWRAVSRPVAA